MSPTGEPPLSRALAVFSSSKERRDLERKVLSAAFKASFESGDTVGAALAHKGLCTILQAQLFDGDGSSGSVIPASVWQQAGPNEMQSNAAAIQGRVGGDPTQVDTLVDSVVDTVPQQDQLTEPLATESTAETSGEWTIDAFQMRAMEEHEARTEAIPALTEADLNEWNEHDARTEAVPALTEADLNEWNEHDARTEAVPALTDADLAEFSAQTETSDSLAAAGLSENTLANLFDDSDAQEAAPGEDEEFAEDDESEEDESEDEHESADDESEDDEEWDESEESDEEESDEEFEEADGDTESENSEELEPAAFVAEAEQPVLSGEYEVAFECVSSQDPAHLECTTSSPAFEPVTMPVVEKAMFEAPMPEFELAPDLVAGIAGFDTPVDVPATGHSPEAPGPLGYLDFGEESEAPAAEVNDEQPSAAAIAEMLAGAPPTNEPPRQLSPSELIKTQTFYQILGVNKLSPYEIIHTRYLRIMRRLLQSRYSVESPIRDMREFREILRAICVAHDVLKDPVTRTDYDLRQLGMRSNEGKIESTADGRPTPLPPRAHLMIGELLECANILDNTELQIALDMHKAEPGVQFGEFLVRAGFLNPEELDSALLGQKLISAGKITVAQFQTAMFRMRDHGTAFFDTLMVEGWITPSDIFNESSSLWDQTAQKAAAPTAPDVVTPPPAVVEPLVPVEPLLPAAEDEAAEAEETDTNGHETQPAKPAAVATGKVEFSDEWTKSDTLAETQTLDVHEFRKRLQARSRDEKGD